MHDRLRWDPEMVAFIMEQEKVAAAYPPVKVELPLGPHRRVNDLLGMRMATGGPEMAETTDRWIHATGRRIFCRVYRPVSNGVLPTLIYFHGGAFNGGTVNCSLYDGTRLCHGGDVVVVTVNHRLNTFGFLYLAEATPDPVYADSGNAGMLDLVLALSWIRTNIALFGGDASSITIFGQSA